MLIQIKTLTWDPTIYPRTTQSRQTIDAYAQALAIGAQFPPIKIQRVFNYADGQTATILRLSRLGWTQEKISGKVGINQQRISQITNNANFGNIGNLLSMGHTMEYIAAHLQMDLALARATRSWTPWPVAVWSRTHACFLNAVARPLIWQSGTNDLKSNTTTGTPKTTHGP
ncbi:transcriptional regulator [Desulfotignum phosphitoxidans]|jgi:hypothetical protein|uniref:HTH cro/C1-type domain-containing protein n=1 Tax=Desulfotignum phosphitoxidans DSM 13687 TaxID=1286635 RepID=S0G0H0_9BACT|nr:transcriptional regulator [Desulfotignum phosphitoxidans]EMS77156.1 hypothetical protein Dpo_26c00040 [Desulfotignum phosphitoxidans DSM 13687]